MRQMTFAGSLARSRPVSEAHRRVRAAALAIPLALFMAGLLARLWAVAAINFPLTEGSAYYTTVARNLVVGGGLEIDAIWSYGTPPLTLPRPAFELWQPLASLLAALPMPVLGATFDAAQVAFAIAGALLAPLAWLVARDAAGRLGLDNRRATAVSIGSGVLAALSGPFVLSSAVPDSTLPFTLLAVSACLLLPRAAAGERPVLVAFGAVLGLAYLARLEAIYVGAVFAIMAVALSGPRAAALRIGAVAAIGGLVAAPWWLRNISVFGSPTPGQVSDNMFLTTNEQIFAYASQPTAEAFLAQGVPVLLANVGRALWHDLVNVLVVPGGPLVAIGLLGVISVVAGRRYRAAVVANLVRSPLVALLLSGALTFAATSLLFPVATLWGTFEHAAGPVLLGLVVAAALAADGFVACVRRTRGWQRSNAWLAPATLVALTLPVSLLHIGAAANASAQSRDHVAQIAAAVPAVLERHDVHEVAPLISDRPIWLAEALGRPAIALPDEPAADVVRLAREFGATAVVVVGERGRHPHALRIDRSGCFTEAWSGTATPGAVFVIDEACR